MAAEIALTGAPQSGVAHVVDRVIGAFGPDRSLTERVALFAAAASVGPSFEPGLQPRRTIDQAIATGVIAAATLSAVTVAQSGIESVARLITGGRTDAASASARLAFTVGSNIVIGAVAEGLSRALPPREDERMRRGLLRVAANRTARVAALGAGLSAVIGTGDLGVERNASRRWMTRIPLALPAGTAVSAWHIHRVHKKAAEMGDTTIDNVSLAKSAGIAAGVGAGVIGLQVGERAIAHGVSRVVARVAPNYDVVSNPIGHAVALTLLGGGMYAGYEYAVRRVEQGGAAVEPAYDVAAQSPMVSGSPQSVVPFDTLSREGRRFVNMVLTREEIDEVMGEPSVADPIRVFVGLDSAAEVEDRVDLVMDELVRTGAFDRKVLCFASPTGSGYVNYVLAEALEYMTLGDCAIATMQYSMLPSSMSLTRTGLAVEQNRDLMHAITGYLRGMDPEKRPRFVLFGESLGALTMQDVWRHRTVEAMDRDFVHSSIFLGTPSATEFAKGWRINPDEGRPRGQGPRGRQLRPVRRAAAGAQGARPPRAHQPLRRPDPEVRHEHPAASPVVARPARAAPARRPEVEHVAPGHQLRPHRHRPRQRHGGRARHLRPSRPRLPRGHRPLRLGDLRPARDRPAAAEHRARPARARARVGAEAGRHRAGGAGPRGAAARVQELGRQHRQRPAGRRGPATGALLGTARGTLTAATS